MTLLDEKSGLRAALGFLTILPVSARDNIGLAHARAWFPVVGLVLGGVLAALDLLLSGYLFLPEGTFIALAPNHLLVSALLVVTLVALTRGLHLDGFMDSCDALFGGYTRARRLEILRDPHVGAFAVVGVACLLLIKFTAIAALHQPLRLPLLILFPCLSRWAMLLMMELYPYVREEGLGVAFLRKRGRLQLFFGFACALCASLLAAGIMGLILLLVASLVAWITGAWVSRRLGGVTGDSYGAVNEIVETAVLALACFIPHSFYFMLQLSVELPW